MIYMNHKKNYHDHNKNLHALCGCTLLDFLKPRDALWRHGAWTRLIGVMVCPLFRAIQLLEAMLTFANWILNNRLQ